MEVGSLLEAEYLTFRNHSGGDTLDAFTPLAQYTQRVHHGQMEKARAKIISSFFIPNGTLKEISKVKE